MAAASSRQDDTPKAQQRQRASKERKIYLVQTPLLLSALSSKKTCIVLLP
jgi:hypothetical protein